MSAAENKRKNKEYSDQELTQALKAIQDGTMTRHKASKAFNIPTSTLFNKMKEKHNKNPGQGSILSKAEEDEIVEWIEYCAKIGSPRSKKEILQAAAKLANTHSDDARTFGDAGPSRKWFESFLSRNPSLTLRKPEGITAASSTVTPRNIDNIFKNLTDFIEKNGYQSLYERPDAFYNLDESGVDLNAMPSKVVTSKRIRHTYMVESAAHHQRITVTVCVGADGSVLTPQIIFKKGFSRLEEVAFESGVENQRMNYSITANGWQETESYFGLIQALDKELEEKNVERPIVIAADGHASHLNLDLYKYCRDRKIIYFILYPNTTHYTQPCDKSVFKPLKAGIRQEMEDYKIHHNKTRVDEVDFIKIFARALKKSVTPDIIKNGFRSTGLFPLDRTAINDDYIIGRDRELPPPPDDNFEISEDAEPLLVGNQEERIISQLKTLTRQLITVQEEKGKNSYLASLIQQHLTHLAESSLQVVESSPPMNGTVQPSQLIAEILPRPDNPTRKGRKRRFVPTAGVMTDSDVIKLCEDHDREKQEAIEALNERKKARLDKKEQMMKKKEENLKKKQEKEEANKKKKESKSKNK